MTHKGKQYVGGAVRRRRLGRYRHGGGPAGRTEGLGAVGAYKSLSDYTQLGGVLTVFALPN